MRFIFHNEHLNFHFHSLYETGIGYRTMQKRLDKFLCDLNIGSRSQVKSLIQKGLLSVNGEVVKKPEFKVSDTDTICYQGKELTSSEFAYFMLHKPAGIISATEDKFQKTVLEYFKNEPCKNLYPVGRLDKDTEGLLLITNDGELGHRLLSPRHHISKTYYVTLMHSVTDEEIHLLESGVDIGEKKLTLPAKIELIDELSLYITITEGKFHQIKRMFEAVSNKVVYLKRISMGNLALDHSLLPGTYRKLTDDEVIYLKSL